MHNNRSEIVEMALEIQNLGSLDLMRDRTLHETASFELDMFEALECQNQDLRKRDHLQCFGPPSVLAFSARSREVNVIVFEERVERRLDGCETNGFPEFRAADLNGELEGAKKLVIRLSDLVATGTSECRHSQASREICKRGKIISVQ